MAKVPMKDAIETIRKNNPHTNVLLGSNPRFYASSNGLTWCAKMHLLYSDSPSREVLLERISNIVEREILSAKEIYLCEAIVLWNNRDTLNE